jgi:hypothetical protein
VWSICPYASDLKRENEGEIKAPPSAWVQVVGFAALYATALKVPSRRFCRILVSFQ